MARNGRLGFRILPAVAATVLLCVALAAIAQEGNSEWHASVMMQLQQLGLWNSGALAGKASLVTKCAQGVDSACDALANDPGAVAAMQHVDAKNPHGFAAKHPHKSAVLQRKLEIDHPSVMYPPAFASRQPAHRERELLKQTVEGQEEHRVPEPLWAYKKNREAAAKYKNEHEDAFDKAFGRLHVARRVPEPLSYYGKGFQGVEKDYKTAPSTKEVWKLPAWKDGALGGGNTQWLKACAEGNYYACGKIEKSNDDIHDALLPQRDAIGTHFTCFTSTRVQVLTRSTKSSQPKSPPSPFPSLSTSPPANLACGGN